MTDTDLHTRFKVYLEMEYLNNIIEPNTCCTDEEMEAAAAWAKKAATFLLQRHREWEEDGRPGKLPDK